MAERLFGTDGVRGRAGLAAARRADRSPPRRRARARAAAGGERAPPARRPRHARVGRAGSRASWRTARAAAGGDVTSAGVISTPGRRVPHARERLRRGRRHLRLAQPVRGQRHQGLLGRRREVHRAPRARDRERSSPTRRGRCRTATPRRWPTRICRRAYLAHARAALPLRELLRGLRVAVDCANGATTRARAAAASRTSASTSSPSGARRTGATSTWTAARRTRRRSARTVVERRCRLGVAFDGDGDRAIFVDETGRIVDGDAIMLLAPATCSREGRLKNGAIVATVMSNIGLEIALRESGHRAGALPGRRQVRDGGDDQARPRRSAASSRATSSSRTSCSPATASSRRSTCCR